MRVAVLGSGSWGTALTILLARNGHEVRLFGRDPEEIAILRSRRENLRYLPGFVVPQGVEFELLGETDPSADMTVVAIPSGAVREVLSAAAVPRPLVVLASKGLEPGTGRLLADVVRETGDVGHVGVLSGPNLAIEVVRGVPTVALSAFADLEVAERVRAAFNGPAFRVSVTDDVVGVELGGALKNVLAIGAGMSDGLGFGDNTKGAFLSRGLMETARLGVAMGAHLDTFLGPAGVGDLVATAASPLSRNYRLGRALGEGATLADAVASLGQVAEGVPTSEAVAALARRYELTLPIFVTVEAVLRGRLSPRQAVSLLMERTFQPKDEPLLEEVLRESAANARMRPPHAPMLADGGK